MENSDAYRELKDAKRSFGSNPKNDSYFHGKYKKRNLTKDSSRRHMAKYYDVFQRMHKEYNIVDSTVKTFADVCCAPGGFAKAVLDIVPDVVGEGMTIDPDRTDVGENEKAGHDMQLPNSSRWNCFFRDVMEKPQDVVFFGAQHKCDFMIVDGNFLFSPSIIEPMSQELSEAMEIFKELEDKELANSFLTLLHSGAEGKAREVVEKTLLTDSQVDLILQHFLVRFAATDKRVVHVNRFLCSKVLVGLQNLRSNCNLMVQNGIRPTRVNFWMWGLFLEIFAEVIIIKATLGCHGINSSAYVLCKGYNIEKAQRYAIPMVRKILILLDEGRSDCLI